MAINVVSREAGGPVLLPASAVTSVALQDKLARCTRQLGDWEACAFSKTPEGKKIIQNLRAQIGNLESHINTQNAAPPAQSANGTPGTSSAPAVLSILGALVNVFA